MTFALTPDIIIAAIVSGAIIGVFLGTFGGGGSVLAAPLLLYVVGVSDPHVAIGTSAAAVAAIALFSLVGHWRGGNVKWPCAIVFALSGFAGSIIGSSIAKQVDGTQLLLAFSVAMAVIALSMFRKPAFAGDPGVHLTRSILLRLAPLGLIVGMAAGFFGIGGGFLIVPGLMLATAMPLPMAIGTSLVAVSAFGAATAASYAASGLIDWPLAGLFILGGVLGGLVGSRLGQRLAGRKRALTVTFAGLVILVGLYVVARGALPLLGLSA